MKSVTRSATPSLTASYFKNIPENGGEEEEPSILESTVVEKKSINYKEENILFLFHKLMYITVEEFTVELKKDSSREEASINTEEEQIIIRDFYDLNTNDFTNSELQYVGGSKVAFKRRRYNPRQSGTRFETIPKYTISQDSTNYSDFQADQDNGNDTCRSCESWFVPDCYENVRIKFISGNVFEGTLYRKQFHGKGVYRWHDGVTYEGEFNNGEITGSGSLYLSDMSYYIGDVCKGLMHGFGSLYVSASPLLYSGEWQAGRKHGKGWILYGRDNWYDGQWVDDKYHGLGHRQYNPRTRYKGNWVNGYRCGLGTMVYKNGDFYSGEWKNDLNHGYGEYTWKAFLNRSFTFALENMYQGMWVDGARDGAGIMQFGIEGGARLTGIWSKNKKNGPGILVCGNGAVVQGCPLFVSDKPVHVNRYESMSMLSKMLVNQTDGDWERSPTIESYTQKLLSNKSVTSVSELPKYNVLCQPTEIRIYSPPEKIYVGNYISRIVSRFNESKDEIIQFNKEDNKSFVENNNKQWKFYIPSESTGIKTIAEICSEEIDESREEQQIRRCFLVNSVKLRNLYTHYATLCYNEITEGPIDFEVTMIRLFFWKLYRDMKMNYKYSMVELDRKLFENKDVGFETIHHPFEKIYFWQFLHCLIEMALMSIDKFERMIRFKERGILTSIFQTFLDDLLVNTADTNSCAFNPYNYIHLLPIDSVYLLYESMGEPHKARKFLNTVCNPKQYQFFQLYKVLKNKPRRTTLKGVNIVPVGENITFYQNESFVKGYDTKYDVADQPSIELSIFSRLGPQKLIQCLAAACPLIVIEDVICNMDYQLTFLEFYETLIFCSYLIVDEEIKEEKREYEVKEEVELIEKKGSEILEEIPNIKGKGKKKNK